MREFAWEREALAGKPIPAGLTGAEQTAYTSLRALYSQYAAGLIDRDAAKADKVEILKAYELAASREEFLVRSATELRERISAASAAYLASPTTENADRMYSAFWALPQDYCAKYRAEAENEERT